MNSNRTTSFTLGLAMLAALPAGAATLTIDGSSGAVFDGVIDGFPMVYAQDGTPDAAGNALSVALKAGVTEMRAIAEFPLDSLAGLTSADIDSATLSINIDDVVGSFGPGAAFDGTASESLYFWAWNGNGVVDVTDFGNVVGPPAASLVTGAHGSITDTTLGTTGPVEFEVDVTAALKVRLDASATDMGVTIATLDENTATSLDNLGFSGAGPAVLNGAHLPFLTVVTIEDDPPVFDAAERKCQAAVASASRKLADKTHKALVKCFDTVLKATAAGDALTEATTACGALLAASSSKVADARVKASSSITSKCVSPLAPADIHSPCDDAAASFADTAECVLDAAVEAAATAVRASYADSCAIVTAVGLDADYPTLCETP